MDILKERNPYDDGQIDEILEILLDVVCSNRKQIRIAGDDKPAQVVKSQLMKLDSSHIAVTSFNELSASIKEKEKRLAEIQVLKTHIINYVKTKDVYADYRKCGYSKKFLEEHRQEILLHNAAKNAFDELHVKKIPKVKELNAEYAEILAEKKKLYGEYRQTKKDMQEIQRAKYDIDQFLKDDEEKKKERTRKRGITL